jgi:hypothetical protein
MDTMENLYKLPKTNFNPQELANNLNNNTESFIEAVKQHPELVNKAKETLNELESVIRLIEMLAKNVIIVRIRAIEPTVFLASKPLNSVTDDSSVLSTPLSPLQIENTPSPQQVENSPPPQQVENTSSPTEQPEIANSSPIQQVDIVNASPLNPELADNSELTVYHSSASDDDVLSVNNSTDVSDYNGDGFISLYHYLSPSRITYSGQFREDHFNRRNYEVDLWGPDTETYRNIYYNIGDAIKSMETLISEYTRISIIEHKALASNFIIDYATNMLYTEAISVIDILSAIN